ncbi:GntR family transcriptional regulator [Sporosarcina ureae]|uniref:GntR family transcriptional regulator n=1 Tax=Sporosarcina ureae TaxID=1571 RepID=A0ABM6JW95_SPOUR|nr:GntR family transcriptional regulator [Sporosarcina ureae]ARF14460.1 GntR family transcriptional regulator [Sporosarcina ureae]
MGMEFLPDKPIYQQLVEHIIGDIIRDTLVTGEKLPSVRDYAISVGVNANTMQRVYKELENLGITETRRGQGSFVTENQMRIQELREEMKEQLVQSFIQNVEALGFTTNEMVHYLQRRGEQDD